jgi:hypothetical protein
MEFVLSFDQYISKARKFWNPSAIDPKPEFGKKRMVGGEDIDLASFEKDFLRATSQLTKFVALSKAIAETLEANGAEEGVKKKSFWSKFKGQSNMEKEVINLVKESRLPFNAQKIAEEFAMLDMEDRQQFINAAKLTKVEPILHDIESSFSQSKPASWFSKLGDRLTSGLDKVFPGGFHKPVPDSVRV